MYGILPCMVVGKRLVEAAGIEPASENDPTKASTRVSRPFNLALPPSEQAGMREDQPGNSRRRDSGRATAAIPLTSFDPSPRERDGERGYAFLRSQGQLIVGIYVIPTGLTSKWSSACDLSFNVPVEPNSPPKFL